MKKRFRCKIGIHFVNHITFAYGRTNSVEKIYFIRSCKYCNCEVLCGSKTIDWEKPDQGIQEIYRGHTYIIIKDDSCRSLGIKCLDCGKTSYSEGGVEFKFCGRCVKYHHDNKKISELVKERHKKWII
jgi:hypothetical protein